MKRVHRYRAWDNTQKHFVYFELFDGVNNHTPPIYSDAVLEPWEEFTGLKDRYGVEIYEGDIIDGMVVTYCGDQNAGLGMNCGYYLQRNNFESWVELESSNDIVVSGNTHEWPYPLFS